MMTTYLTIENHLKFLSVFNLGIEVFSQVQAFVDLIFKSHCSLFEKKEKSSLLVRGGISL